MIFLLLSILASTLIYIVFKLFSLYKVDTLQAIIVNYFVATCAGIIGYRGTVNVAALPNFGWFIGAALLGALFILIFNLMAITTQRSGLAVVSVATKMSVVIPVMFGIWYYDEAVSTIKALGILLAVAAVYLASAKNTQGLKVKREHIILPILVFVGSGIIDTSIKYLEDGYVSQTDVPLFSSVTFATAFIIGLVIATFQFMRGRLTFALKNIVGGFALGIPNYFSIYFLVRALRIDIESSTIFTLNNVSIVLLSTLLGIVFFKEKLIRKNWVGIAMAVVGIILVSLSL